MSSPLPSPEYIAENSKGGTLATITVVATLATLFVFLRFGVQLRRRIRFALDDWLPFIWGLYAVCAFGCGFDDLGRHITVLGEAGIQAIITIELYFFVADYLYATALATAKLSILAMYYRVFPTRFMKFSTVLLGSIVVVWWLTCIFLSAFGCNPIQKAWDPFVPGSCLDHHMVFLIKAVPNFSLDFLIFPLPILEIMKLRMRPPQKIALGGAFLIGALAAVSSIVRLVLIAGLANQNADITYTLPKIIVWTVVEPSVGIISACLPRLRPLLTMIASWAGSTRVRSKEENKKAQDIEIITFGQNQQKKTPSDTAPLNTFDSSKTVVENSTGGLHGPTSRANDTGNVLFQGSHSTVSSDIEGGMSRSRD
ncbi:hypothetical protein NUW58_g4032 [Xylaria curta]|uniref:Uncharacterized protein n=1 Tax=Xylaria curta TaxID=42375 RepID=A0ACC1P9Q2_9PEZI|nr:hypothetical protein NUW58_g4032 [Xylaria curta]